MATATLADKMAKQSLPRNSRVIPRTSKIHPAMASAREIWARAHGGKFAQNAGRFGKKK